MSSLTRRIVRNRKKQLRITNVTPGLSKRQAGKGTKKPPFIGVTKMNDRDYLLALFEKRDANEKALRIIEGQIKAVGRRYSKANGYIVPLSTDALRLALAKEKKDATQAP